MIGDGELRRSMTYAERVRYFDAALKSIHRALDCSTKLNTVQEIIRIVKQSIFHGTHQFSTQISVEFQKQIDIETVLWQESGKSYEIEWIVY